MFSHLAPFAGDPILGINTLFQADQRSKKVNLSIGIYLDEEGEVPLLATIHEAERRLLDERAGKPYLPIEGTADMRAATLRLVFGDESKAVRQRRISTVQTVGSSGALKIAADFIKHALPDSAAWVSSPTWENHRAILLGSGVPVHMYPYYDATTDGVDFPGMCATLESVPRHSVVVLHGCCHNPTGVDLSPEQWTQCIALMVRRELVPLVDLAYQGFAQGLEEDTQPLRELAVTGIAFFVANSYSKNMSLYGERAGALSVVSENAADAELVFGQLQAIIRRNWSNPPMHANRIVSTVLDDPDLHARWVDEVAGMRRRIQRMRQLLHAALLQRNPERHFDYLLAQQGMFSYTGLSADQVRRLRDEFGVYLIGSGRICVAALSAANVDHVADSISAVL